MRRTDAATPGARAASGAGTDAAQPAARTIDAVTSLTAPAQLRPTQRSAFTRYRQSLWLLTKRDLSVRYSTNALGYVWSVLDPLLMSAIYFFVFVVVFKRGDKAGEDPYIVFLIAGLLPWTWFNSVVTDAARVFSKESKLVRSTALPRTLWVARIVLSKGIEFVASLLVLVIFAVATLTPVTRDIVWFPLAVLIQAVLVFGLGLLVAPLTVFYKDLERAIRLILRLLFYSSPVVYSASQWPKEWHGVPIRALLDMNPLAGVFGMYRAVFWPQELDWNHVLVSAIGALVFLGLGAWVFNRSVPNVLKEM